MKLHARALAVVALSTVVVAAGAVADIPTVPGLPTPEPAYAAALPLAGKVIVIDPGHQLGNYFHPKEMAKLVDAGGLRKPCNTTGTATNSGYRETAFTMSVAKFLRARLRAQGATVHMTRVVDSKDLWGPCVDERGKLANKVHADVLISIHGDGAPAKNHGFFVIRPAHRKGITNDIYTPSGTLSTDVRSGLDSVKVPRANYYGGDGLDTRNDMGTLNRSDSPAVMIELGNMRNATDAKNMKTASYRDQVYAAGLAKGVAKYLKR